MLKRNGNIGAIIITKVLGDIIRLFLCPNLKLLLKSVPYINEALTLHLWVERLGISVLALRVHCFC